GKPGLSDAGPSLPARPLALIIVHRGATLPSRPMVWRFAPRLGALGAFAERLEAAGYDGVALPDGQNLGPDPYIALALAAKSTSRLLIDVAYTGARATSLAARHPERVTFAVGAEPVRLHWERRRPGRSRAPRACPPCCTTGWGSASGGSRS